MGITDFFFGIAEIYKGVITNLPDFYGNAISLILGAFFIVIVALFVWKFYNSLSKKDLVELNLMKYRKTDHPVAERVSKIVLYFAENVVIMPLLILLWFAALSVVILLVSPDSGINHILFLSAAMVMAIRILAYANEEIGKDLAKLFPFITLSVFLLSPVGFGIDKILTNLSELPALFGNVFSFLSTIFLVEVILRLTYSIVLVVKGDN